MASVRLCAGVDPVGSGPPRQAFLNALTLHDEVLLQSPHAPSVLKPNLAFFLAQGSSGLALLEQFVARHRALGREVILDCKCNEIANSLEAWLHFAFVSLGATGLTLNPFLGEKTIFLALEWAAKNAGAMGRVYVLCATSEFSAGGLAYLQGQPERIIEACCDARQKVVGDDFPALAGVVVGANRTDVLDSVALRESAISVLAPGLGAQGADWATIERCAAYKNEITFPVSRAIFRGGDWSVDAALAALSDVSQHFR